MTGPDVSRLAPGDAVAALRSFGRRFRAVLALGDDEDPAVLDRPGPDGRSAAEHAELAARELVGLAAAVRAALGPPEPEPPAAEAAAGDPVALLEAEATALADRAERVPPGDWAANDALDLLREAVRSTAAHLRAAELARFGRDAPG